MKPHVPDAWIDTRKRDPKDGHVGLVGYEINFNRYFYRYTPPRPLEEIEADIRGIERDILRMLAEVTGVRPVLTRNGGIHTLVPTFRVDQGPMHAQNAGMVGKHADESGSLASATDPAGRLRAAGFGAFFRPSQVADAGITRDQLRALVHRGQVEHVGRGLYRVADAEPTEHYSLAMACARVPNSVVCLLSALRVHGIGTRAPAEVWLAIPHKARKPRLPELRLRIVRFSGPAWTFGVQETAFEGVPARLTSPARTVADCFRFERLVGPETAIEALQDGLRQHKLTIAQLARVAEVLPSRRLSATLDARLI